MSNNAILAIHRDSTQLKIVPKNWKFMEMGQGHIILENSNDNDELFDKVLSICRHQIGSFPHQFDQLYQKVLSCSPTIKQCLLEREQVLFEQQQMTKFKQMLQRILDQSIQNCKVFLAQNLARSKNVWDYYMQFKPKTILPDLYSTNFLNEYCIRHKINFEKLITLLQTSPQIEKTRWFKKNALKQKKKNMNPFEIFSYHTSAPPNYIKLVKAIKQQKTPGRQKQQLKINNSQIVKVISESKILLAILKLQLLYTQSHDFNEANVHELWNQQNDKQVKMKTIVSSILSQLKESSSVQNQVSSLLNQAPYMPNKHSYYCQLQKIIRFLISWSWKDISIILRFKVDASGENIIEYDVKIIDYELKETSKLVETIKKDQKFLSQYLLFKQIQ